jgi:hypothetical protein
MGREENRRELAIEEKERYSRLAPRHWSVLRRRTRPPNYDVLRRVESRGGVLCVQHIGRPVSTATLQPP